MPSTPEAIAIVLDGLEGAAGPGTPQYGWAYGWGAG
jgi:hypothetical protein